MRPRSGDRGNIPNGALHCTSKSDFNEAADLGEACRHSGDKLATVGFRGLKANNTRFFWPIWSHPVGLDTLHRTQPPTLGTSEEMEIAELQTIGIEVVYRCRRILVGKTPNLTAPEPVLTN